MSSKSKQDPKDDRKANSANEDSSVKASLPFEPTSNKKKTPKKAASTPVAKEELAEDRRSPQSIGVPEAVSRRMVRRMALLSGIPTSFGMLTFIASYIVVTNNWFKVPNVAVVLVSMGFFGLGVLGLSYGVLSASWDEERVGSWLGQEEFSLNFKRLVGSWRSVRQKPES